MIGWNDFKKTDPIGELGRFFQCDLIRSLFSSCHAGDGLEQCICHKLAGLLAMRFLRHRPGGHKR